METISLRLLDTPTNRDISGRLTVGKIYEGYKKYHMSGYYYVTTDEGDEGGFFETRFEVVSKQEEVPNGWEVP